MSITNASGPKRAGKEQKCGGKMNSPSLFELRHPSFPIFFFFFCLFRVVPLAYGSSQARGRIRATAASLYHSHSYARSESCLQPTPQLTVTPDP